MGKKSAPAAPDYNSLAIMQAAANAQQAEANVTANRVNQTTPYGSLNYTKNPNGTWSSVETVSPEAQHAIDSQIAITSGRSDAANDMLGRVTAATSQPFNAPKWDSYLQGVGAVDTTKQTPAGQFTTTANVNQNVVDPSGVNVNAPQYSQARQDQYAKAAYDAQYGLLAGDMNAQQEKLQNQLALQGLAPNAEASTGAMGSYYDARSRQLQSLAAQATLTGNQMSNNDYASQLAGFNAGNQAVGQNFNQQLASQDAYNKTQQQKFAQDQGTYQTNLQGLTTNAALQQAYNQAQAQQYAQAQSNYGTNWQQEQTLRNIPLNEMNALLSGQQIQNPTFTPYAAQQYTPGPDYLGAAQAQYNNAAANSSSNMGMLGNLAGGIFGAAGQSGGFGNLFSGIGSMFSDARLKENIHQIGETPGGAGVYSWQWNAEAKKVGADKQPNIGVIAQENPHAAIRTNPEGKGRGYLMVDYSRIQ